MVRFDHVSKQFSGGNYAIHDVTVTIEDGEFVFLIGPSGAGKSTMLRLLIRDLMPSEGDIFVDDWQVNTMTPSSVHLLRRQVRMVFQDFKLLYDRTVRENVALGLEILGKSQEEIGKGVTDILGLVGLSGKAHLFPQQLSAGELQRTSIARAIVGGPKILLADEPTGNLDPKIGWDIIELLDEVNKLGTTVIIATHNVSFVNQLKKRTMTLENGKIVRDELKGKYHLPERRKKKHDEEEGEE